MRIHKKAFMKHLWRIQQLGILGKVVIIGFTVALILLPMVKWRFIKIGFPPGMDLIITIILWGLLMIIILFIGFIYDRRLRLWVEEKKIVTERNPYAYEYLYPKEALSWQYTWVVLLSKLKLKKNSEFMMKWNEDAMNRDSISLERNYDTLKWVRGFTLSPPDKRYLRADLIDIDVDIDIAEQTANRYYRTHKND